MPRLAKSAALLGAASLLVLPALGLRAQPPAPTPAETKAEATPAAKAAAAAADVVEKIKEEGMKRSEVM